ncbi:MAG: hypothetical protein ACRKFN_11490 [Desulfitobacterium sp.]
MYELDALQGRQLAALDISAYRQGVKDALFVQGELDRAKNGLKSIFS